MKRFERLLSICAAAAVWCVSSSAAAEFGTYEFDATCAPERVTDSSQRAPDVLVVLDRSGSMRNNGKWRIARDSINDLISATQASGTCDAMDTTGCDEIRLGFGYYSGSSSIIRQPQEDSGSAISSWLARNNPTGGTQTGRAVEQIRNSTVLANPDNVGIGVVITDGRPDNFSTVNLARNAACEARNRMSGPVPTYMVGFGSGSDENMNSYMAAAGGTGTCCRDSSGCTFDTDGALTSGEEVDPCDFATGAMVVDFGGDDNTFVRSGFTCRGSIEAGNAAELKTALLDLAALAACTFPLDIPTSYPEYPSASADPYATRVILEHDVYGDLPIPPVDPAQPDTLYDYLIGPSVRESAMAAAPYRGEGFFFPTAARTTVQLTPRLCEDIVSDKVDFTLSQVACLCPNEGNGCDVTCGTDPGSECEASNTFQVGRCRAGRIGCVLGAEVCYQDFTAQPEICNGIDDNCDGSIDNVESAAPGGSMPWDPVTYPLNDPSEESLFCGFRNSCGGCGSSPGTPGRLPGATDTEWSLLLAGGTGSCVCGAGLEGEGEDVFSDPFVDPAEWGEDASDDEDGGCSTGGRLASGAGGGLGLVWLLAIFVGVRRRSQP